MYYFEYENDEIKLNMDELNNINEYKSLFEKENINFQVILKMMIIHWFGLAEYNKNNVIKSISSIFIGYYLYYKYVMM